MGKVVMVNNQDGVKVVTTKEFQKRWEQMGFKLLLTNITKTA